MDAPQDYKTAGIFMMISGILTVLVSLSLIFSLIWILVGCFWVLTLVVGIFEIILGIGIMQGQFKGGAKTVSILGLISAFFCGNLIGLVLEILAIVWLGKPEVNNWMALQAE